MEKITKKTLLFFCSVANEDVSKIYNLSTILDNKHFACDAIGNLLNDELNSILIQFYIWGDNDDEPIGVVTLRRKNVRFISFRPKESMAIVAVNVPYPLISRKTARQLDEIFAELIQIAVHEVCIKLSKKIKSIDFKALENAIKKRCIELISSGE